jgi:hypothetical protein
MNEAAPSITRWLASRIKPHVLFAFIVIGFGVSCLCGRVAVSTDHLAPFTRFHRVISADAFYYPTAMQLKAMLDSIPEEKIVVVAGGTSRLWGVGQSPAGLWTRELQRQLGDQYYVINLALRGGRADAFGQQAMEMLIAEKRRAIYAADWMFGESIEPQGVMPIYRNMFRDAYARDMLLAWPRRDKALALSLANPVEASEISELIIRARLNTAFYFDDLWETVGLRGVFFAAYFPIPEPFRARGEVADIDSAAPAQGFYDLENKSHALAILRSWAKPSPDFSFVVRNAEIVPPAVRNSTVLVTITPSPYYFPDLSAEEHGNLDNNFLKYTAAWNAAGFHTVQTGDDWSISDYVDLFHVSELGGRKLASLFAPLIREKAKELRYVH